MDQRRRALDRANEIRVARARFKKQMSETARPEAFTAAIEEVAQPRSEFTTFKTEEFLKALPGVGKFHASRLVSMAGAKGRLGYLTPRQRAALSRQLEIVQRRRYPTTEEAT